MKTIIKRFVLSMICTGLFFAQINISINAKELTGTSEASENLYDSTYESLKKRITDRGYAATSLTGAYDGMFIRDSSIQTMAHNLYGDYYLSKNILDYLLRYHQAIEADSALHIIPNLDDLPYDNSFMEDKEEIENPELSYSYQTKTSDMLFGLNRNTKNGGGVTFIPSESTIKSISIYTNSTGNDNLYASLRTDIRDETSELANAKIQVTNEGWQKITFDNPINVTIGEKYYLFVQADSNIIMYGSVQQPSTNAVLGFNYDENVIGGFAESAYPAFIINDDKGNTKSFMSNVDKSMALFKVNNTTNNCAFGFIPNVETIRYFKVYLTGTGDATFTLTTDPTDPEAAIETVTKKINGDQWYDVYFNDDIKVNPGETYYIHMATTSGEIIAYGSNLTENSVASYNWENGTWFTTGFCVAFQMFTDTNLMENQYALPVEISGNVIQSIDLKINSSIEQGVLKGELRESVDGSTIASGQANILKGEQSITIDFGSEISVLPNHTYYLVISSIENNTVRLNYDPAKEEASYILVNGKWMKYNLCFYKDIFPKYSGDYRVPIFNIGNDSYGVQEIPSKNEHITAVDVILGNNTQESGKAIATLYKKTNEKQIVIDQQTFDISNLSSTGEIVHITFRLPIEKIDKSQSYFLKIESPQCSDNAITWYGTQAIDRFVSENKNGKVNGEASFIAYKSNIRKLSDHKQIDGNYMLIHAWNQFVMNAPKTEENKLFINQTYPIIKKFADYYIDNNYINQDLKLIRNDSFEHSREGRYWNSYDLITNVFASQALYELSIIAQQCEDGKSSDKWNEVSKMLTEGINQNLITEVDGRKIYAELYDVDHDMKLIQGMSWVNWAPVAAEWYGMDKTVMQNTYDIYQKYGSQNYNGYKMLDVLYDFETGAYGNHVIGKGLAWEIMYNKSISDIDKSNTLVEFILDNSTENGVYPETYQLNGSFSDVGNQEHASWQHYAMSYAYPELTKKYQLEKLNSLLKEFETIDLDLYTNESVNAFRKAFKIALENTKKESITKEKLKNSYNELLKSKDNLILKQVDKSKLEKEIERAEKLNKIDYTKETWENVEVSLSDAKSIMQDSKATQEEVDAITDKLKKAIDNLERQSIIQETVDKKMLKEAIDRYSLYKEEDYTVESWNLFKKAYEYANDVYKDMEASQNQVDNALNKLTLAANKLEKIGKKAETPKTGYTLQLMNIWLLVLSSLSCIIFISKIRKSLKTKS